MTIVQIRPEMVPKIFTLTLRLLLQAPALGSTPKLSLTPLLALDRLQSYLCRLMVELRAENALCPPEIDIIVINQPNRSLWHDRGLA